MTLLALSDPPRRVGHGPHLDIDLDAVAANTRLFAQKAGGALMAVVKADGFGHGAVDVARTALGNGASWLGVTSIDEAIVLRRAGLRAPMLSWLNGPDADFGVAIAGEIDLAVPSRDHLEAVMSVRARARGSTCTSTPAWPATAPPRRTGPSSAPPPAGPSSRAG